MKELAEIIGRWLFIVFFLTAPLFVPNVDASSNEKRDFVKCKKQSVHSIKYLTRYDIRGATQFNLRNGGVLIVKGIASVINTNKIFLCKYKPIHGFDDSYVVCAGFGCYDLL